MKESLTGVRESPGRAFVYMVYIWNTVEGGLIKPIQLADNVTVQQNEVYNIELDKYLKVDNNILIVLTTNMAEETVQKIISVTISWEVWIKLHKCVEGVSKDNMCHLFAVFSFKKNPSDNIATHSKMETFVAWIKMRDDERYEK